LTLFPIPTPSQHDTYVNQCLVHVLLVIVVSHNIQLQMPQLLPKQGLNEELCWLCSIQVHKTHASCTTTKHSTGGLDLVSSSTGGVQGYLTFSDTIGPTCKGQDHPAPRQKEMLPLAASNLGWK
jgi:hypothetical protein